MTYFSHSGVEPAIQFVLSNWLPRQPMFYGIYERKVSTMALCKLFEHGVTTNDPRLVTVKIRDVVEPAQNGNRPRTRQQLSNVQQQWVDVPGKKSPEIDLTCDRLSSIAFFLIFQYFSFTVLVKIFKLLVNELNHLNESILFDEESDDSDDDHLNVETDPNQPSNNPTSPKVFHTSDLWCDDEDDEDDQLLKELEQDPIFQTSLNDTLTKFLQNFTTTEKFAEYAQHLSEHEKSVLRGIQVNI